MTLVNHLLTNKILQTEEIDNKIAFAFAVERLVENGAEKFHEGLPKTRFPLFKNTTKSIMVQKNDKQRKSSKVSQQRYLELARQFMSKQ